MTILLAIGIVAMALNLNNLFRLLERTPKPRTTKQQAAITVLSNACAARTGRPTADELFSGVRGILDRAAKAEKAAR
jgi:hypothetical protein